MPYTMKVHRLVSVKALTSQLIYSGLHTLTFHLKSQRRMRFAQGFLPPNSLEDGSKMLLDTSYSAIARLAMLCLACIITIAMEFKWLTTEWLHGYDCQN